MTGDSLGEVIRRIGRSVGLQSDLALTDAQLLERFVKRRDEPAFAALVARHGPMVLGVCRKLVRDVQEAEDAFQATFLVLARKASGIQRQPLLAGWLYGVAYRVAARLRGQTARRRTREVLDVDLTGIAALDDGASSDAGPLVHEEVGRLPDKYRSAVVLCYLEGKTNEEAALQLRWPVGSVKSRLARARDLLRTRLTRRGLTLSAGLLTTALVINKAPAASALADATIRGAALFAAGDAVAGGLISARAVKLSYGVLGTMIVTKAKIMAALALSLAMLGGAGGLAYRSLAAAPDDTPNATPMKSASRDDQPKTDKEKPKEGESKTDAEAIQGVWRVTAVETEGKERDDDRADRLKDQVWTIKTDKIYIKMGTIDQKGGCPYKIDPTKKPKTLDITEQAVGGDGKVRSEWKRRAIYSLEGDVLKVCYGISAAEIKHDDQDVGRRPRPFDPRDLTADGGRPTELATKEGSRSTLLTLKREVGDKDKPNEEKPKEDESKKDVAAIQGVWRVTAVETEGRDQNDARAKLLKKENWVFKADTLTMGAPFKLAAYKLDATKIPKTLDMFPAISARDKNEGEDVIPTIYLLDGDTLKICLDPLPSQIMQRDKNLSLSRRPKPTDLLAPLESRRPKELTTKEGGYSTLLTLKRETSNRDDSKEEEPNPAKPAGDKQKENDAKMTKLRQDWRAAANKAFEGHLQEFQGHSMTSVQAIEAARRLLKIEVEWTDNKADRLTAYQTYLERTTEIAKCAQRDFPYDKAVPDTLGEAEAGRLEAEMMLEREKAK